MVAAADIIDEIQPDHRRAQPAEAPLLPGLAEGRTDPRTPPRLRRRSTGTTCSPSRSTSAPPTPSAPTQAERQELLENLIEEERGDENHPELWLRFGEGVGATRAADRRLARRCPRPSASSRPSATPPCNRSFAEACAALYVYESQVPEVAKTKIAGLKQFYGIDAPRALQFFEVHIGADEIHAEVGAGMVRTNTRNEADREAVLGTARECADALWSFLDGCHREYVAAA